MTTKDGSAEWKVRDGRTHHMCGEIVALVTTPPDYEHLLLCDGQTISADDYPELVKALGSTTLPNLNGRVLQGGETAGQYKEAGLPNLEGYMAISYGDVGTFWADAITGVFHRGDLKDKGVIFDSVNDSNKSRCADVEFDASRSNPIYGASTTVQPPAYTVRYYICYG